MRILVKAGVKLCLFGCRRCGQIELLSQEENELCGNCGEQMSPMNEDGTWKVLESIEEKQEKVTEPELEQKPRKKVGRPKKNQTKAGTCAMCKNALRNNTGYTCEIDWQNHDASDSCPNHKDGVPVD